jgi:hypothetical protein
MKTIYKYICFEERHLPKKTRTFLVKNKAFNYLLGEIKWYAPWRKYCFCTSISEGRVFDAGCLSDIQEFITQLMSERKEKINANSTV